MSDTEEYMKNFSLLEKINAQLEAEVLEMKGKLARTRTAALKLRYDPELAEICSRLENASKDVYLNYDEALLLKLALDKAHVEIRELKAGILHRREDVSN